MEEIAEAEIRARLRAEVDVVKASRNRLAELRAAIPPSAQEDSTEDLYGSFDLATEVRTLLAILLKESFKPLLRHLSAAADYQPVAESLPAPDSTAPAQPAATVVARGVPPSPVRLDLTADEETMRPLVYALVVKDNFTARPSDDEPGKILIPPTAEEVRLQVWKLHGRWFACWVKPDAPEDAPDDERWEVLLVEEDKNQPGSLFYREL